MDVSTEMQRIFAPQVANAIVHHAAAFITNERMLTRLVPTLDVLLLHAVQGDLLHPP